MTWYMLATLLHVTQPDVMNNFFYITPTFKDEQQCVDHLKANITNLSLELKNNNPNWVPNTYYCIREDKLREYMELIQQSNGTSI